MDNDTLNRRLRVFTISATRVLKALREETERRHTIRIYGPLSNQDIRNTLSYGETLVAEIEGRLYGTARR